MADRFNGDDQINGDDQNSEGDNSVGGDSSHGSFGGFDGDNFLANDMNGGSGSDSFGGLAGSLGGGTSAFSGSNGMDDSSVVTARGTGDGLVLRLDGRIQLNALKAAILSYVETRQGFLVGQEVIFEWLGARPEEGVVAELTQILSSRFGVLVKASRMVERSQVTKQSERDLSLPPQKGIAGQIEAKQTQPTSRNTGLSNSTSLERGSAEWNPTISRSADERYASGDTFKSGDDFKPKLTPVDGDRFDRVSRVSPSAGSSLFDGLAGGGTSEMRSGDNRAMGEVRPAGATSAAGVINESLLWDDPDARIIRQTLRSGQKIESEFSVIINGDVNSGAEVVAGGDVIVLGKLRGVVHAGAFEESGRGRFIFAVQMQPTQLRIGSVISRGSKEDSSGEPEIARVEGTMITVESFLKGSNAKGGSSAPAKKRW